MMEEKCQACGAKSMRSIRMRNHSRVRYRWECVRCGELTPYPTASEQNQSRALREKALRIRYEKRSTRNRKTR
jgi:thymidine kinase